MEPLWNGITELALLRRFRSACFRLWSVSGGSKGGMKVGGVKEISPNTVESTIGIL